MRKAIFRFTTRRFIVLVAILATLLASGITVNQLVHLRAVYRERAIHHGQEELDARSVLSYVAEIDDAYKEAAVGIDDPTIDAAAAKKLKELMKSDPDVRMVAFSLVQQKKLEKEMTEPFKEVIKSARSEVEYHAYLKRKYERAAARPWLSVLPDAKASGVNLWLMMGEAIARSESKAAEIDRLPLPPQLEIIEPEQPSEK
jgi:hypothetical protein